MGRISPGPTRWPPGAERRLVPAKSNLKPQTSNTTHALLSPDPETLPMGEVSRLATGKFLGTNGLQGQPTVAPYAPLTAGPNSSLSQRYGPAIIT